MNERFPWLTSACLLVTSAVSLYAVTALSNSVRHYRKTIGEINFREFRTEIRHLSDLADTRNQI